MADKKINLEIKTIFGYSPPGRSEKSISKSLPFYKSRRGKYLHRVRSASNYWHDGELSHTSVHFWCGAYGFLNGKGRLYPEQDDHVICATCEGRVVGAGLLGAKEINGNNVMFSPRKDK